MIDPLVLMPVLSAWCILKIALSESVSFLCWNHHPTEKGLSVCSGVEAPFWADDGQLLACTLMLFCCHLAVEGLPLGCTSMPHVSANAAGQTKPSLASGSH